MQSYGDPNHAPYQRPPSTATFGTGPPPVSYGGNAFQQDPSGYPNASANQYQQWPGANQVSPPQQQAWGQPPNSQFQPPHPTQTPQSINQVWGQPPPPQQQQQQQQPQQSVPNYNPNQYEPAQGAQVQPAGPPVPPKSYQNQGPIYSPTPPPPPPKPSHAFDHTAQQPGQTWSPQPSSTQDYYQHLPSISEQGQSTDGQYPVQPIPQPYGSTAAPPPSQTLGGSYFPATGSSSNPGYDTPNAGNPAASVLSPDEQHPAYIPPSLSGQGTAAYVPTNTNPLPGVYVPPPPDIPAWTQASHKPLAGPTKKFTYTRPMAQSDPTQGSTYQTPTQYNPQYQSHGHHPSQSVGLPQIQSPVQQTAQPFGQPQQFTQSMQPPVQQYQPQQSDPWNAQPSSMPPPPSYEPTSPLSAYQQQGHGVVQPAATQQAWQSNNIPAQTGQPFQNLGVGQTTTTHTIAPSPQTATAQNTTASFGSNSYGHDPVSPITQRQSISLNQTTIAQGITRTDTSTSKPQTTGLHGATMSTSQTKESAPSPPLKPTTGSSALGLGGPSDWEYFGSGGDEEIDDTADFETKATNRPASPQQLDSVELPAQPSSPPSVSSGPVGHSATVSAEDNWPTPPAPAPLNLHRPSSGVQQNITSAQAPYAPTPPPQDAGSARPMQSPPRQTHQVAAEKPFVATEAHHEPKPVPQASNTFVMDDAGGWVQQASTVPHQAQSQQQNRSQPAYPVPAEASTSFVVDDGGWQSPAEQASKPAQAPASGPQTSFVMDSGGWIPPILSANAVSGPLSTSQSGQKAPVDNMQPSPAITGNNNSWAPPTPDAKAQELSKKEEQLAEQGRELSQKEKTLTSKEGDLARREQEVSKKEQDIIAKEQNLSRKERELTAKEQEFSGKQQDLAGREKDLAAKEQDLVAKDIDATKRALELKEGPPPRPGDLIPDLDPWYVGSLERFLAMLRAESAAVVVDDKIKVFTEFLAAESQARGIPYYRGPPPASTSSNAESVSTQTVPSFLATDFDTAKPQKLQRLNTAPVSSDDAFFMVEQALQQYSPGGRPVLARRDTSGVSSHVSSGTVGQARKASQTRPDASSFNIPSTTSAGISPIISAADSAPNVAHAPYVDSVTASDNSVQSAILTPTSSTEDELVKPAPPPQPEKPVYKPYTPGETTTISTIIASDTSSNRHSVSLPRRDIDEIFLEELQPQKEPAVTSTLESSSTTPTNQPVVTNTSTSDPLAALQHLLPSKIPTAPSPHSRLSAITSSVQNEYPLDFPWISSVTSNYDKSASAVRSKNEAARRKRQEESEARTDELFNNNEIAYADIAGIENEFKEHEAEKKRDEDKQEYDGYVAEVFDHVYGRLQREIGGLMEMWVEVETMVPNSASGKRLVLEDGGASGEHPPSTLEALQVMRTLHGAIEARHAAVVSAVTERDKRYKKTEVAPLYAAGHIAKVKSLEKHFDLAEKNAVVKAREDKVMRMRRLIAIFEDAIVKAVASDQNYRDELLNAADALVGGKSQGANGETANETAKQESIKLVGPVLRQVSLNSRALMTLLGEVEVEVLNSVLDVDVARARAKPDGVDQNAVKQIEDQRIKEVTDIEAEAKRRLAVLEADERSVEAISAEASGSGDEQDERMRRALEEAKRRNGVGLEEKGSRIV